MNDIFVGALAFIPFALFAIYFIKSRSATAQVWISFARRRGLEYNDLRGAGKNQSLDTSMKPKQSSTIMRMLSIGAMPRITGENNGFPFELSTLKKGSGNNKVLYSFMKLELENLPTGIYVYPEKSVHKVIKIFGYQDVQTGDPEFDGKFMVKGENPEQVLSYLTWNRQTALKKYSITIPNLELRKGAIYMERRGLIKKTDELETLFRELGKLATALT